MNRRLIVSLIGGVAVVAAAGVLVVRAEQSVGPAFIAGDKPVTEDQIREKLLAEGYANVQIVRRGRTFLAMGSKAGQTGMIVVDAQNGRLRADDDDDDD